MSEVNATLEERGNRYGSFVGHAKITQDLKDIAKFHLTSRNKKLACDQQEALDMIFHKIGRIINGDADYIENFRDIAGYATLVMNRMKDSDGSTDVQVIRIKKREGMWVNEITNEEIKTST